MESNMEFKDYLSKKNVESIWELSLLQKDLLEHIQSQDQDPTPVQCMTAIPPEGTEPDQVESAWNQIVANTPILRAVFRKARNRTVLVTLKRYPSLLHRTDRDKPAPVFNLMEEAGVRAVWVEANEGPAQLLLYAHPILVDRTGMSHVLQDLFTALEGQKPVERPPYKEYLDWLAGQYWVPATAYWKKELADFTTPTSLTPYQRFDAELISKARYTSRVMDLGEALSLELNQFCGQQGLDAAALALGAWALMLNLYSHEDEIYFGVHLPGPPAGSGDFESMIAPFANTLPIHVPIDPGLTVKEFLDTVSPKYRQLRQYSYIPLRELKKAAVPDAGTPLFESSVSVHTGPDPLSQDGTTSTLYYQRRDHGSGLEVVTGDAWQITFHCYDEGLPATIVKQILERLQFTLRQLARNPVTPLGRLNRLSQQDADLLDRFNRTDIPMEDRYPDTFMHLEFEKITETQPDHIACVFENHYVTYQELNQRANRLAHWLRDQGLGPNRLAGIFCERAIEMLIAILAVFKSGGAYIPLDPGNPNSRIITIIDDSRLDVILTRTAEAKRTAGIIGNSHGSPRLFCLEPLENQEDIPCVSNLKDYPENNPVPVNGPRDASYVLFTSGSTGLPKGAIVEHTGMSNHLWTKIRLLDIGAASKVVQNASHCFDISVWQFLCAIMTGGQTVIYSKETAMTPWLLLKAVRAHRITILEMVPAVIEMVLNEPAGEETLLPDLITMLSTGEALPTPLCRRWLERYPDIPVVNAYGPTECSDDTHHQVITSGPPHPLQDYYNDVPLGAIIPNFKAYVLDKQDRALPPGCPGEVCLTGVGVGKGYLNNPERTAQAFAENPFGDGMGPRMYRTGDLGYIDDKGQMIFLGRIDFQVKIRGFRIELGEIEARLRKHEHVNQCVTAINESGGQKRIVAYTVLDRPVDGAALRQYLQETLPHYMVPEYFVELEQLPLTRSGKIDRKALPDPDTADSSGAGMEPPQTGVQKNLALIWEDVLETSPISLDQNFFEMGGHSLRIIQIRSRVNRRFNVDIPILDLFRMATIREQAAYIEARAGVESDVPSTPLTALPPAPHYPMSNAQQRLFFLYRLEPDNTAYNLPTVLRLRESLDTGLFTSALRAVIRRHGSLRTTFGMVDDQPVQFVADDDTPVLQVEDLSSLPDPQRTRTLEARLKKQYSYNFQLSEGPLFYTIIYKLETEEYLLFFNMHHIISDLWSWEIFFNDLIPIYQQYKEGNTGFQPSPLDIQYTDFAAWQHKSIENGDFQVHAEYWKERFAGEPAVLDLPLDYPRGLTQKFSGGQLDAAMPPAALKPLYQLFRQKNITSFIGLMAVIYAFLSRITGQHDITLGTPELGRNRLELEGLIGFFVNTLPLRFNLEGDPSFLEVLEEVKQVSLEAYEHAAYPFDLIINQLDLERDLSRYPLFSAMFELNDVSVAQGPETENSEGKEDEKEDDGHYESPSVTTNYDLQIIFTESPDQDKLTGRFIYCKDLFKKETIENWLDHLGVFFEAIAARPEDPISIAPLLTEAQQEQLMETWNRGHTGGGETALLPLHRMIENQCEQTPDAIALSCGRESLGFRQLNIESACLARLLAEKGVREGDILGLMMERSLDLPVAVLGLLKTGAAYLSMEPQFFPDRYINIMTGHKISMVLTNTAEAPAAPAGTVTAPVHAKARRAYMENSVPEKFSAAEAPDTAFITLAGNGGLTPVRHRALSNLANTLNQRFFGPGGITLAHAPMTRDHAFLELIMPLSAGSRVIVAPEEESRDPLLLKQLVESVQPTVMHATPVTWRSLLSHKWRGNANLTCLSGGLPPEEAARTLASQCRALWHMYGHPETAVYTAMAPIDTGAPGMAAGRAIANTYMMVLNPAMQPVPAGISGELYIGGACLAGQYLNEPETAAKTWVNNPFNTGGPTLFKTGTLARVLDDSRFQFMGPMDDRVTIKGYRVRLSDIENQLLRSEGIEAAAVRIVKDENNRSVLTAYIQSEEEIGNDRLSAFLAKSLPGYMIPGQYIPVSRMPLTPDGRVDTAALPKPGENKRENAPAAPANRVEKLLALEWEEVLEKTDFSVSDNFFQLGGHSIKGIKLISKLKNRGIYMSINDLFIYQTIRSQARFIMESNTEEAYMPASFSEVAALFHESFGFEAQALVYLTEAGSYHVLYYPDKEESRIDPDKLSGFFRDNLSPAARPHYIRRLSEKPASGENQMKLEQEHLDKLLGLDRSADKLPQAARKAVQEQSTRFNHDMVSAPVELEYPLSAMQRQHSRLLNRFTHMRIFFQGGLDIALLEEALLELVSRQGLLRSTRITRADGQYAWRQRQPPRSLSIPLVDLQRYSPVKQAILGNDILENIILEELKQAGEHTILFRPVLFKADLKNHVLALYFDHAIYDGMSEEVIERNLMQSYRARLKQLDAPPMNPRSYADYVRLLSLGPHGMDDRELAETFRLEPFSRAAQTFGTLFQEKQGRQVTYRTFERSFSGRLNEENAWEAAFLMFHMFLERTFGQSAIPSRIVSYGRRYGEESFFDTVGEFIDFVPVLVETDGAGPAAMVQDVRQTLDKALDHHINFMNLEFEPSMKEKWPRSTGALRSGRQDPDDPLILFNFAGRAGEQQVNSLKQNRTMGPEWKVSSFMWEIYFTSGALYCIISTSLDIDLMANLDEIAQQVEDIIKSIKPNIKEGDIT